MGVVGDMMEGGGMERGRNYKEEEMECNEWR